MRRRLTPLVAGVCVLLQAAAWAAIPSIPILENPNDRAQVEEFFGKPAKERPVRSFDVPRHPFMAANQDSNIHNDAYMTDAYERPGPLGRDMVTDSTFVVGDCASVTFDQRGNIITICVGVEGPRLFRMDPVTLDTEAYLPLPARSPRGGTGSSIFQDFAGGGYFYLDHKDRAVLPTTTRQIWVVSQAETPAGPAFAIDRRYDLATVVPPDEGIVSVLPDWDGLLWFVGTQGTVGTVDPKDGSVQATQLEGEAIANSFAVDETGGAYIVSDHALYRFDADKDGAPKITWRQTYDRGERVKPGQASQGSGTTPTVVGERYVAITDNADPYMHVLVYDRRADVAGDRLLCSVPVFGKGEGNTDQSLIAVGDSLIVENNYGYSGPSATMEGATTTPGLERVRFGEDGCETVWRSDEIAPSAVPKISLANGLVYTYTKPPTDSDVDAWYLTAIDFRTGKTIFKRLAGTGLGFNNNYAPVSLGPDGAAYVGVLGGLVRLADS